jgi:1-acyl-sn-glycerol-3-phosphate acyltransferase
MNSSLFLLLTVLLLSLPHVLLSRRIPAERPPRPEIHGIRRVCHWIVRAYCAFWHRLQTNGWAPLPEFGAAILIANHTCMIDHLLLQAGCRRVLGFMIAREYYEWPLIHGFCRWVGCIPVNRDGRDVQATRTALRALEEGRVLPIFPEGKITPSAGRELGELRPGAAFIAIRAGVPVIPAYIKGSPESSEVGPSLWTLSRANVTFGQPIDLSPFNRHQAGDKAVQAEVSRRFMQAFLELRARQPEVKDVFKNH